MEEIWKSILGFEDYTVSNLGRVMNKHGRIMKQSNHKQGYKLIGLKKDKKLYCKQVHRLVALAFIPNPDNLPQVNHKDECKTNNCVDNLEWCDAKYNINYGTGIQRHIASRGCFKQSEETKHKISEANKGKPKPHKGHPAWNKGKITSEEQKVKISTTMKGKHNSPDTEFKKGQKAWNKGKTHSEETRQKMKEAWIKRKQK